MTADTHANGDTLHLGIHSHWGQAVRRRSRGEVLASLCNNGVNMTADTHAIGDTL